MRAEQFFDGFPGNKGGEGELAGHLLVMVDDDGQASDHFRVALTGGRTISHTFDARAVTAAPGLAHYSLTVERTVQSIQFKTNCYTSKWENLDELVASEKVQASTPEEEDADDLFRAAWADAKESEYPPAAALRWAMQANERHGFDLVLQAMPATARSLRCDARLTHDTTRTIELARWAAATPMLHRGRLAGPQPLLFAADAGSATRSL